MDIGEPQRVIIVEPIVVPDEMPQHDPAPLTVPDPEPVEVPAGA